MSMFGAGGSTACITYHQYGQRCTGTAPCRNCRRRLAEHGSQADGASGKANYYEKLLSDIFLIIQSTDEAGSQPLLDLIRNGATFPEVRCWLDQVKTGMPTPDQASTNDLRDSKLRTRYEVQSGAPPFRSKVMDIHYLCDSAPFKVPAKPWTSVTDDDALVSHLVSLYFTWDYPFYAFLEPQIMIRHMRERRLQSDFCSPFLVNALLANACHYSHYSEAYAVPGDVKTKGTDFLAEAERHLQNNLFEKGSTVRLASLQATLLLYERYSMVGDDDHGYTMLNQAVEMAEGLGIINSPHLNLNASQMSEEMIKSVQRTAWGLFQIDTIVHTNFLRKSLVNRVSIPQLDRDESKPSDKWVAYPLNRPDRPLWLSQAFDEACKLSYIARDMSRTLSPKAHGSAGNTIEQKRELYSELRRWEENLPATFAMSEKPAPHIILLRMRYHALLINLYCDWFEGKPPFDATTGEINEEPSTRIADAEALGIALTAAREIAALTRMHKGEYGMERAHQFVMYAILLALFALLEQKSFNVLDHDFLSLTSAFSVISSRSQVGMHLFHIFRNSVKFRLQCGKWESSVDVPPELGELFFQNLSPEIPDRWNHYAEGLQKLADKGEYIGSLDGGWQLHAASGINDMLRKYETLSVGRVDELQSKKESSGFGFSPS
ncbi:fungal-specific transcription factor domain-containing protein [Aspergillus recurvatus]